MHPMTVDDRRSTVVVMVLSGLVVGGVVGGVVGRRSRVVGRLPWPSEPIPPTVVRMTTFWYGLAALLGLVAVAGARGPQAEPIRVRVRRHRRR